MSRKAAEAASIQLPEFPKQMGGLDSIARAGAPLEPCPLPRQGLVGHFPRAPPGLRMRLLPRLHPFVATYKSYIPNIFMSKIRPLNHLPHAILVRVHQLYIDTQHLYRRVFNAHVALCISRFELRLQHDLQLPMHVLRTSVLSNAGS